MKHQTQKRAIVLTDGLLSTINGKTAHGLLNGSERFEILAIVDQKHVGKDAGTVFDGKPRNIPIFATLTDAIAKLSVKPDCCVVGIATHSGKFTESLITELSEAIKHGLDIVNGLHDLVCEHQTLASLADNHGVDVTDIRKVKPYNQLQYWQGTIHNVKCPIIAVLGMDCAVGKRTTCKWILEACRANNINAEMIYTGQTGWMQGMKYGFIFDSTLNDFVSGELEKAVVLCAQETNPELILLEGQSSLRNPCGPCGAEMICSANAKGVVLQYAVGQINFDLECKHLYPLPTVQQEIDLIQMYGAKVLAVTLNTSNLSQDTETWQQAKQRVNNEINIPVICPKEEGVDNIISLLRNFITEYSPAAKSV